MPWDITIIRGTVADRQPLGTQEEVLAAFAESLQLEFEQPGSPPQALLEIMPPSVREAMVRKRLAADFEAGDLSIQFYASDEPILDCVNAEVRGNGDPLPALAAVCVKQGWSVIDCTTNTLLDLTSVAGSPAWERFCTWRDQALDQIRESDE